MFHKLNDKKKIPMTRTRTHFEILTAKAKFSLIQNYNVYSTDI